MTYQEKIEDMRYDPYQLALIAVLNNYTLTEVSGTRLVKKMCRALESKGVRWAIWDPKGGVEIYLL